MEFIDGFQWAVSTAFLDAIGQCRFEEGDILYDTQMAYGLNWSESKKHIQRWIQVRHPSRTMSTITTGEGTIFENNWTTKIKLDFYDGTNKTTPRQITTTQGRLYTTLWKGDISTLTDRNPHPPIPDRLKIVLKQIGSVQSIVKQRSEGKLIFVIPIDHSNRASQFKLSRIHQGLGSNLYKLFFLTPLESGIQNAESVAPTIAIACFLVSRITKEDLHECVKKMVYNPSKYAKTDQYKISAHGAIF